MSDREYVTGSSWHPRSRKGAVLDAYADTGALERDCTNCGAEVGGFCTFQDGSERHAPCCSRTRTPETPKSQAGNE